MSSSPPDESRDFFGFETDAFYNDSHVIMSEYLVIFTAMISLSLLIQHVVKSSWKITFLPDAAISMIVGMGISGCIRIAGGYDQSQSSSMHFDPNLLGFSSTVFFFGFLPPIIFDSGYHLKRQLFYANFGGILALALAGSLISTAMVSVGIFLLSANGWLGLTSPMSLIECISFGSLISSTDPVSTLTVFSHLKVDPSLYYLVFGESVLNDAIAITLFTVTSKYIGYSMSLEVWLNCFLKFCVCFVGSCGIGYLLGIASAYCFKIFSFDDKKILVVAFFVSTVYIPFFLSEALQLSGIVTILFSGIAGQ
jgi:NhaP-type Na+/H+ or K+/H+ antiporter